MVTVEAVRIAKCKKIDAFVAEEVNCAAFKGWVPPYEPLCARLLTF